MSLLLAPSAPQRVTVIPISSRAISLSWQRPIFPNGVIRHYRVKLIDQSTARTLTSTSLNMQINGLHPYRAYSLRVAAVTVVEGSYFNEQRVQTFQDGKNVEILKRMFLYAFFFSAKCIPQYPSVKCYQKYIIYTCMAATATAISQWNYSLRTTIL